MRFDDGHSVDIWTRVARGYRGLLQPLFKADGAEGIDVGERGPFLSTIKRIPVEGENLIRARDDIFANLTTPTPAALIYVGHSAERHHSKDDHIGWEMAVEIVLVAGAPGDMVFGRLEHDPALELDKYPGLGPMAQFVIEELHCQYLPNFADGGPIEILGWRDIGVHDEVSLWAIDTEVLVEQVIDPDRAAEATSGVVAVHNETVQQRRFP